jgi:hypothetical protein
MYGPSLVKIHSRILILEFTWVLRSKNLTWWHWPWKSIGFQTLLRIKYVPSLVKIHWRILILECSQGCYAVKIWRGDHDLWPWKSIESQNPLKTKYVPSLVKIHWRMLISECSQGCYVLKIWPLNLKINRVPDSSKDYVCTKFGQNPLKDVDSRVFTRMLHGKKKIYLVTLTYDLENQ